MNPTMWTVFAESLDRLYRQQNMDRLSLLPNNHSTINQIWEILKKSIKTVANKTIPFSLVSSEQNQPKPNNVVTFYRHLKKLNNIVLKFRAKRIKTKI